MSGIMEEEEGDEFPVGMRVLAIDDDPTCLRVLEAMLRRCKYHVTTVNQAIMALEMLRENKVKFDLIITDVHMPDMDGFKLLELVGLELDLPVIMLSANGDKDAVMKGITHGACDYLVKPVRMEELKNIWQHVVRKKRSFRKESDNSDNGRSEVGQYPVTNNGSSTHRKRKDHNEEGEVEDNDDNMYETENVSTNKKRRVVWNVELHQKFVAAINQLGVEKAVPKRILTLMNDDSLTRENVASHLQKYRLYMRKLAVQETEKDILTTTGAVRDSNLPLASLDTFGNFQSFTSPNQIPVLPSFPHNAGFSRMDPTYNTINPMNSLNELQNLVGSQQGNNMLQRILEANNHLSASTSSSSMLAGYSNNPIGNFTVPSIRSSSFEANSAIFSHSCDPGRFNESWQSVIPLAGASSNLSMSPLNVLKGLNGEWKYFGGVDNTQQQ